MEDWKEYKLKDVAYLTSGFPFDGHKYGKDGVRVVRGDNVTIGSLRWDSEKDKRWSEPFERASEYSLMADDIVIGMDGSRVGKNRAQVKASGLPLLLAQRVACVRHNELSIQSFLYYQIFNDKFEKYIKAVQTGTSIPHVSLKQIGDYPIMLPPLAVQYKFSDILKSLDDKIECNRRINENLEQQAQALFKSWFVDFEPFKDQPFVESELGMIPQGWRVQEAQQIFNINIGKTPPRKESEWFSESSEDNVWVSIADMGSCGAFISDSSEYLTDEAVRRFNVQMVEKDSILLSFKLTVGRVAIADTRLTTNEAIARFILPKKFYREFLYLYLKQYKYGNLGSTSSIATAVNSKTIKGMRLLIPNVELIESFSKNTRPLFEQIRTIQQESRRLAELRDTLLPRLMSGELKVNDLENNEI